MRTTQLRVVVSGALLCGLVLAGPASSSPAVHLAEAPGSPVPDDVALSDGGRRALAAQEVRLMGAAAAYAATRSADAEALAAAALHAARSVTDAASEIVVVADPAPTDLDAEPVPVVDPSEVFPSVVLPPASLPDDLVPLEVDPSDGGPGMPDGTDEHGTHDHGYDVVPPAPEGVEPDADVQEGDAETLPASFDADGALAAAAQRLLELSAPATPEPEEPATTRYDPAGLRTESWATDWQPVEPRYSVEEREAVMTELAAAGALADVTSEVFRLAMAAGADTTKPVAVVPTVPHGDLPQLHRALEGLETVEEQVAALPELTEIELDEADLAILAGSGAPAGRFAPRTGFPWANGAFPLDELCAPTLAPDHLLRCDAAEAFDRLAAAYAADTGETLGVVSSYRTFGDQIVLKAEKGWLAAEPGTSNHGLGIAVDIAGAGGLGDYTTPVYRWLAENAADFGWYHPPAMQPGGSGPPEPWHWEYWG